MNDQDSIRSDTQHEKGIVERVTVGLTLQQHPVRSGFHQFSMEISIHPNAYNHPHDDGHDYDRERNLVNSDS